MDAGLVKELADLVPASADMTECVFDVFPCVVLWL